jgi:hypothetical protein
MKKSQEELDRIWEENPDQDFDEFVNQYIGRDESGYPECYGTGDMRTYCIVCSFQSTC